MMGLGSRTGGLDTAGWGDWSRAINFTAATVAQNKPPPSSRISAWSQEASGFEAPRIVLARCGVGLVLN